LTPDPDGVVVNLKMFSYRLARPQKISWSENSKILCTRSQNSILRKALQRLEYPGAYWNQNYFLLIWKTLLPSTYNTGIVVVTSKVEVLAPWWPNWANFCLFDDCFL
jgi:hypothetical protein